MYKSLAYDPKYALNAICPYFTMFPLEFPLKALKKHKKDAPIVFDPFCGRGTTIYAARNLGIEAWGFDTSPIAIAIAKAKLATATQQAVISLAKKFITIEPKHIPQTQFFKFAYSSETLKELCSIREGLLRIRKETGTSILLRAAALGCLHGPISKTIEGAGYFSNQMPRTFATKPDYSVQYWKKRNLKAPKVTVINVLSKKLERITDLNEEIEGSPDQIICTNSCENNSFKKLPKNISTVVTSPPYYGMTTYIQDQWLRMWFLGGPETVDYNTDAQIKHCGVDAFIRDLSTVWKNIYKSKSEVLDLYIRFGSLPSTKKDAKGILRSSLEDAQGWKILSVRNASDSRTGKRQADQMTPNSKPVDEFDFHVVRA
jgi:hypothetical protein